jgi:hypothetical protein
MRSLLPATGFALLASPGLSSAGPLRACEQVSALVEAASRPLFANQTEPQTDSAQLVAQVHTCVHAHNICAVVYDNRKRGSTLVTADVTADLPQQDLSRQGQPSVLLLLRSIPRVRNDSNQYCLLSVSLSEPASTQEWNVSGWVVAPNGNEALPLQKQVLHDNARSDPRSLRGLAAALWFFAARMSGQSAPQE